MVEDELSLHVGRMRRPRETPVGMFKLEILRAMMAEGGLFESTVDGRAAAQALETLNGLVETFASGRIAKLRPSADNTLDFRIRLAGGDQSFSFDGLSSGQKEIISTLFLIWHCTRGAPAVVLIDEPELHLNPEWHSGFFDQLGSLAPGNQYIIATHSNDVFGAVRPEQRVMLEPAQGETKGGDRAP